MIATRTIELLRYSIGQWDETKHPRGQPKNRGQFAQKQSGENRAAVNTPQIFRQSLERLFAKSLGDSGIEGRQAGTYLQTARKIFAKMPGGALVKLLRNIEQVVFYSSVDNLTHRLREKYPGALSNTIGGAWECDRENGDGKGVLHLDGALSPTGIRDVQGIYSHEIGHVCDWNQTAGKRISASEEWMDAFSEEVVDGQLGTYAALSYREAFAEFARLCWSTGYSEKQIKRDFPRCWAVFLKNGLVK